MKVKNCFISWSRLEWVAIPFFRGSSGPRDGIQVSLHFRQILYYLSHLGSWYKVTLLSKF